MKKCPVQNTTCKYKINGLCTKKTFNALSDYDCMWCVSDKQETAHEKNNTRET